MDCNLSLCSAELLSEMSREFDMDVLNDEQKALVEGGLQTVFFSVLNH